MQKKWLGEEDEEGPRHIQPNWANLAPHLSVDIGKMYPLWTLIYPCTQPCPPKLYGHVHIIGGDEERQRKSESGLGWTVFNVAG